VIKKAVAEGQRLGVPAGLVTFKDHPRTLTLGRSPQLLTLLEQRLDLFAELGIAKTLVLTFSEEICRLTPREYVEVVLLDCLGARSVSIGYNHHFGRNREGDPALLSSLGQELGFEVHIAPEVMVDGVEVSSSRIRAALGAGNVEHARRLLSRPYAVDARVVRGQGRGRGIGFPTANLEISELQVLPGHGVYAAITRLADGRRLPSVVNLGYRPTVSNDKIMTAEAHVLDFDQDLYGTGLVVEFWHHLRAEKKFESIDALRSQIDADCRKARELFAGSLSLPGPEQRLHA